MRIRRLSLFERIFHNTNEYYKLEITVVGTESEIKRLQSRIIEMVNGI